MKLQRVKCKALSYVKEISVSDSYIIGCTGKKANILDKNYNLLQTIEGLDYVYSAEMSPDEKELLLISNENKFYIVNLETGFKRKVVVKAPYNYNIEGRGCWSYDGKYIYIVVMNSRNLLSTVRRYNADDFKIYKDYVVEKYVIHKICKMHLNETYLILGYSRDDEMDYLLFFDGEDYKEYPFQNMKCESGGYEHPNPKSMKLSFSKVLDFPKLVNDLPDRIEGLCNNLGLEDINVEDGITKIEESKNGKFKYISSESGFYVVDKKTGKCLVEHQEEYGVQNFIEFENGLIALEAFGNVKLYRLIRED